MKKPEQIDGCPFCDNTKELLIKKRDFKHIPKNNPTHLISVGVKWWYYECGVCKEQFTTTESDTISQDNLKKQIQ